MERYLNSRSERIAVVFAYGNWSPMHYRCWERIIPSGAASDVEFIDAQTVKMLLQNMSKRLEGSECKPVATNEWAKRSATGGVQMEEDLLAEVKTVMALSHCR
ncbi:MAG: hypothetical protein AAFX01_07145 [Cyanobacteria bacterium J06638_28]